MKTPQSHPPLEHPQTHDSKTPQKNKWVRQW